MSRKVTQLFSFILLAVFVSLSEAAVWESIPVFPQARREKQDDVIIDNKPVHDVIYSTDAPIGEILAFYKDKMANFGWSLSTESIQAEMGMAIFVKGGSATNIVAQTIRGKNFITVVQSEAPELSDSKPCAECEQKTLDRLIKKYESLPPGADSKAELQAETAMKAVDISTQNAPGKDLEIVPRYPAAARVNSYERNNGKKVSLTYFSSDPQEKIESFYRQNMGVYNWALDKELDLKDAPSAVSDITRISLNGKSLVFKNRTASCIISIFEEPQGKGTIIGVSYNEK